MFNKKIFAKKLYKSPTSYNFVQNCKNTLLKKGYVELNEKNEWNEIPNLFFVISNNNSIIAINKFDLNYGIIISCSTDSPKIKVINNSFEKIQNFSILKLNLLGNGQWWTWLDRDLRISGIVYIQKNENIFEKIISSQVPFAIIPSLAIHLSKKGGFDTNFPIENLSKAIIRINSNNEQTNDFLIFISEICNCKIENIFNYDLYLSDSEPPISFGSKNQFISSQNLSQIGHSLSSFYSFLNSKNPQCGMKIFYATEFNNSNNNDYSYHFLRRILKRLRCPYHFYSKSLLIAADQIHQDNNIIYDQPLIIPFHEKIPIIPQLSRKLTIKGSSIGTFLGPSLNIRFIEICFRVFSRNSIKETCKWSSVASFYQYILDLINSIV